ncbi:hypothetical protein [Mycolicibacterium sp. CBMA 226]|uniref:hypothetical protein n=1 Tax=Mycolicibacterium sp. CBMA 226 TaxID=2606611 RepID=UPI0012DD6690|nr:hypothetical protein [Mycolicibacterium sp. CBMA 226]
MGLVTVGVTVGGTAGILGVAGRTALTGLAAVPASAAGAGGVWDGAGPAVCVANAVSAGFVAVALLL